jgi:nickel-dependent lactate racemase
VDDEQIRKIFAGAPGQQLAAMAQKARRPAVLVDDLTRPTPAGRLLPHVVNLLGRGGSVPVTVLLAGGSHAAPSADAMNRKLGPLQDGCRVVVHDFRGPSINVGTTSLGTPVPVNPAVASADLVVGVGGIDPHSSAGFGGGAKIMLGAMAEKSLVSFHYGRRGTRGGYDLDNDFRRDLEEAAALAGLASSVNVFVDDRRRLVRVLVGPTSDYYDDAVEWARRAFRAPAPGGADVVISNAYPMDVSLTFMGSKGTTPLRYARPGASRVVVAGCPEGVGHHGLFPIVDRPRFYRQRHLFRLVRGRRSELGSIAFRRAKTVRRPKQSVPDVPRNPVHLFVPESSMAKLPDSVRGMRLHRTWDSVLAQIAQEQDRDDLSATVYACAPLQVIERD